MLSLYCYVNNTKRLEIQIKTLVLVGAYPRFFQVCLKFLNLLLITPAKNCPYEITREIKKK